MKYLPFFKRFAPFALSLAAGLLLASIFVPVGPPRFGFRTRRDGFERGRNGRHCRDMEMELRRRDDEIMRLRQRVGEIEVFGLSAPDLPPPPPDVAPPPPPFGAVPRRDR